MTVSRTLLPFRARQIAQSVLSPAAQALVQMEENDKWPEPLASTRTSLASSSLSGTSNGEVAPTSQGSGAAVTMTAPVEVSRGSVLEGMLISKVINR